MIMTSNAHTHTTWCDGLNTPREMADAAVALGFTDLGFSSHSPAPFDPTCSGIADEPCYRKDIAALRQEYRGTLDILCGAEQDYYAPVNRSDYDYIIGSVHYLPEIDGCYTAVDHSASLFSQALEQRYAGDSVRLAANYYALAVKNAQTYKPDIIGHFDLITKFNGGNIFFHEDSSVYQDIALQAMDAVLDIVLPYGGMIEVNTSVMFKGMREVPYPAPFLLEHIARRGARVIITTDSHRTGSLNGGFAQALGFIRQAGFSAMAVLRGGKFIDVPISDN